MKSRWAADFIYKVQVLVLLVRGPVEDRIGGHVGTALNLGDGCFWKKLRHMRPGCQVRNMEPGIEHRAAAEEEELMVVVGKAETKTGRCFPEILYRAWTGSWFGNI